MNHRLAMVLFLVTSILSAGCAGSSSPRPDEPGALAQGQDTSATFTRPKIMVVKASWCGGCKQVEPVLMSVLSEYEGKLDVVVLDVSDDEAVRASTSSAESEGLGLVFARFARKTPTVLVALGPGELVQPDGDLTDADVLRGAFDQALAQAARR